MGDVYESVEVLAAQWKVLSTKLRLKESAVNIIEHDYPRDARTCLREALAEWLKLNYSHIKYGRPSWRNLAKAVHSMDPELFERIASEHIGGYN